MRDKRYSMVFPYQELSTQWSGRIFYTFQGAAAIPMTRYRETPGSESASVKSGTNEKARLRMLLLVLAKGGIRAGWYRDWYGPMYRLFDLGLANGKMPHKPQILPEYRHV